jgi:hypothetical protein
MPPSRRDMAASTGVRQAVQVRTTPILGRKLWFGPRDSVLGWGWRPVSWEGWTTTVLALALALGPSALVADNDAAGMAIWVVVVVVGLLVVAALKGTTPGGKRQARELRRLMNR